MHSKNLVPFKERRGPYSIPGMTGEDKDHSMDQVDHDLSPEEQRFIRHYVGYADILLKSVPDPDLGPLEDASSNSEESKVTEMPRHVPKNTTDEAA